MKEFPSSASFSETAARAAKGFHELVHDLRGATRQIGADDAPLRLEALGQMRVGIAGHAVGSQRVGRFVREAVGDVERAGLDRDREVAGGHLIEATKTEPDKNTYLAINGLKGADAAKFTDIAKTAEGRCPVSNAYRGTMEITVEAKVG